jgi:hypothetical protein
VTTASVVSDVVSFAGTATPGPNPGTYTIQVQRCSLTSDGESTIYPCQMGGSFTVTPAGTSGSAVVGSPDGNVNWNFTLVPTTTANHYKMKGSGMEADAPENGVSEPPYACSTIGGWVLTPAPTGGYVISGKTKVLESSTAP